MEFFCPKCQKKHPVSAITADLLSICKSDIRENLNGLISEGNLEPQAVIQVNNLSKVISGITDSTFLAYSREELPNLLSGFAPEGDGFSGELYFTIKDLRQRLSEKMPTAADGIAWNHIENLMKVPVFRREMTFQYTVSPDSEFVFTSCQDHGDYFDDGRTLLGYRRICSVCGTVLHQSTGLAQELVIVLAGSPRAGKTSCITAVVNALSEATAFHNGLSMIRYNYDEPVRWLFNETEENYKKGKKVLKTETNQEEASAYSLHLRLGAQDAGKKEKSTECILTFVDMPGEFWQTNGNGLTESFFKQYQGIFRNTDCIWLFLSKASAMGVDLEKNPELAKNTSDDTETVKNSSPELLQANFTALIEHVYQGGGKKVPPIAMILTKTDADVMKDNPELDRDLKREFGLFPVNQMIYQQNADETTKLFDKKTEKSLPMLDLRAIYDQGQAVRQFFSKRAVRYQAAIEGCFQDRYYAAMSAYGHPAVERDDPASNPPTPFHELHPLIWTLGAFGILGIRHDFDVIERGFFGNEKGKRRESRYFRFDLRQSTGSEVPREDISANLFFHQSVDSRYKATIEDKHGKGR